ncbi:MAG: hypothetical protein WD738_22950, partial [Pirellulales bacterium]
DRFREEHWRGLESQIGGVIKQAAPGQSQPATEPMAPAAQPQQVRRNDWLGGRTRGWRIRGRFPLY